MAPIMRLARPHEAPLQNIFCSRAGPLRGRDGKGGSAGASVRARSRRPASHPPPPHPPALQGSKLLLGTTPHRGVALHSEEGAHLRDLFLSTVLFSFLSVFFLWRRPPGNVCCWHTAAQGAGPAQQGGPARHASRRTVVVGAVAWWWTVSRWVGAGFVSWSLVERRGERVVARGGRAGGAAIHAFQSAMWRGCTQIVQ